MDISDSLSSAYTDSQLKHVLTVLDEDSFGNVSHRSIRTYAERRTLNRAAQVLDQLKPLNMSLENIGSNIARATALYAEMNSIIQPYHAQVGAYAREAEYAELESAKLAGEQATLTAFMETLYISPEQVSIIEQSELNSEFFVVFNKIHKIHSQSAQALLAEHPQAGEQLMHESSKLLDSAYNRIKTKVELELNKGTTNNLKKFMALLAERPLMFKSVLQREETSRKARLSKELTHFLAQEQQNFNLMPVGYLSSLLAWLHSAIVNEFEQISLLFDSETESTHLEELLNTKNTQKVITELVDGVLGTIESQFRQKVTSLLVAQSDLSVVDELQLVLQLYIQMLTIQFENLNFLQLLEQLDQSIHKQFSHLVEVQKLSWEQKIDVARKVAQNNDKSVDQSQAETKINLLLKDLKNGSLIEQLNRVDYAVSNLAGFTCAVAVVEKLQADLRQLEAQLSTELQEKIKMESKFNEFVVKVISAREFRIAFDKFLSEFDSTSLLGEVESPAISKRVVLKSIDQFLTEYELNVKDPSLLSVDEVRSILT